jgi:tripartite-type tricarboxylate transporter receptor subunit TctC
MSRYHAVEKTLDFLSWFLALLCGGLICVAGPAWAEDFPSRPIRLVVPFPPGGVTDPVARTVGERVARALGQPVVIDNRPGGAGVIGARIVKDAAADGHTLFMGHAATHAVNPHLLSNLGYDPVRDFQPITLMISTSHILVVPESSPARSVAELVALARENPLGLTYASQSVGSGGHLLGEMLRMRTGLKLEHVPYKGSAPALQDVLAGRIDLFFDAVITSAPHVKANKLRALAAASGRRLAILPQLPTMAEAGFPGIELDFWFALFAPAGTPPHIVARLHDAFTTALRAPEMARFTEQGLDIVTSSPDELAALIALDTARLGKVVREAGVNVE